MSLALPAALLTGAPSTAAAGPAGARISHHQSFTKTAITVAVKVGPNRDVPCTVKADLYRPAGVSARHKAPSILTTNGFGGSKDDAGQSAGASAFAKAGYVVISYSGLGFGGSGCKITLDDPDYDGVAGKQLVDVLAGTRSYTRDDGTGRTGRIDYVARNRSSHGPDPKVGMIGGSYGGQIQFAVAEQDRRVDAIIPEITWNDLSYSLAPNNTGFTRGVTYRTPGVAKKEWVGLFFGIGIADGLQYAPADPTRNVGCPNFADQACLSAAQLQTAGYPDPATLALARHASVSSYVSKVRAPTLLVQGQHDTLFNLQEAVATYKALQKQGTPVKMSWFSGGHSGPAAAGDLDLSRGVDASHQGRRWIAWMDRYVRGDRRVSTGREFEYFRDWVSYDTSAAGAGRAVDKAYTGTNSVYTGTPNTTLLLSGQDALVPSSFPVAYGTDTFAATPLGTSYSETSGLEGSTVNQDVRDTPGTFAAWTTPVLPRSTVVVGSPRLTVNISAPVAAAAQSSGPAGHLVLFAKLYDVAPDGTEKLQHRLISPVRVDDVTKPVTIELPGVAQRFAAGHRIRLVLAAGDLAYANNDTPQEVSVTTSAAAPGRLTLPVVGGLSFSPGGGS
ncbi:hypothetical protein GCM10027596_09560 [Nocardioides korecus]